MIALLNAQMCPNHKCPKGWQKLSRYCIKKLNEKTSCFKTAQKLCAKADSRATLLNPHLMTDSELHDAELKVQSWVSTGTQYYPVSNYIKTTREFY